MLNVSHQHLVVAAAVELPCELVAFVHELGVSYQEASETRLGRLLHQLRFLYVPDLSRFPALDQRRLLGGSSRNIRKSRE